jgi:hypothetical protein
MYNIKNFIMDIISNIIWILHLFLVLGIFFSIFINDKLIKIFSLAFLCYLLLQYMTGYEKCGLTELEYYIKGDDYKEGFLYRLINPLIKIPEEYFDKWLFGFHLLWICILLNQLNNKF